MFKLILKTPQRNWSELEVSWDLTFYYQKLNQSYQFQPNKRKQTR